MNITLLGTAHPYRGGLTVYNERLARAFIEEKHQVNIVTFRLQYPGFLFPGKTQYSNQPAPEDLRIQRKLNSINPVNWLQTGKFIRQQNPDLLIIKYWLPFMSPAFGTVARIVRKNNHTIIISILDNIIPHEKHSGDKFLSQYFVNAVDGFVGMSQSVLNDLNVFTRTKPRSFCPHPLYDNFGQTISRDEALKNLSLSGEFRYALFFGLIRDYKGLDVLLHAFANEQIKQSDIKLIVAGEFYSSSGKYLEIIEKLGLQDKIILHKHFIPDNEVVNYFCAADLVVQPYKTATQSGVTQIAYHFNKPMIVTNVGGLAEIVLDGKCGYVVPPENPQAIAEAILKFFNEQGNNKFLPLIIKEKKKYAWSRMTETILTLQKKIKQNDIPK